MADRSKRSVPVKLGEFSVLDTEFDSIRERFDSEMTKMEEEMNKFRNQMLDKDSSFFSKSSKTSTSSNSTGEPLTGGGLGSHKNWLQGIHSPLIHQNDEDSAQKELKLRFDVSQYSPEEIMVKTVDNKLLVHAKHEEQAEGRTVFREYNREFLLPAGTDADQIRSSLSKDGILTVEAPLPQPAITQDTRK